MPLAEVNADPGAGSDAHADWVATCHAFAAALDRGGMEAFADMAVASSLFGPYCSKGPAAQRFLRSCLMTHRAHGIAHTAGHGHLSNLESPAAFNATVRRFLAKAV